MSPNTTHDLLKALVREVLAEILAEQKPPISVGPAPVPAADKPLVQYIPAAEFKMPGKVRIPAGSYVKNPGHNPTGFGGSPDLGPTHTEFVQPLTEPTEK